MVYLTFDDGPWIGTREVIQALEEEAVKVGGDRQSCLLNLPQNVSLIAKCTVGQETFLTWFRPRVPLTRISFHLIYNHSNAKKFNFWEHKKRGKLVTWVQVCAAAARRCLGVTFFILVAAAFLLIAGHLLPQLGQDVRPRS